jgi:hypothetical protein
LAGDLLRAITETGISGNKLQKMLKDKGLNVKSVERTEPTLEDVFLSLAR